MGERIPLVTIVIPSRLNEDCSTTLNSLQRQTFQDFETVIIYDAMSKGACWARNEGFKQVKSKFVLFSDNDIEWKNHALQTLVNTLRVSKASYAYGRYKLDNDIWSHHGWDPIELKKKNYISTMSLIRTKDLPNPPFDENIKRLQDWDLWLTMLEQGKRGMYCEDLIFETKMKLGISFGNTTTSYLEAILTVKKKHNRLYEKQI